MKSTTRGQLARAGAAIAVAVAGMPTAALAEGVGADILIPKPAEFIPALIAFLIIWIVLAKLVWPQILSMMDKRQEKIQEDLDAAESAKSYEQKIVEAHQQADEIISKAKKEAEEERSAILAKAQKEAADVIAKAHGAVDSERHKAMIELSGSVVDLSVEIATKIIGNDLTEDQQRKLAEKYLAEVSAPNGD